MSASRRRLGAAGVILLVIILLVLVAALGAWRGWWRTQVKENDADQVQVELDVDRGRIREDAGELADRARRATQSASVAKDLRTVEGTIREWSDDHLVIEIDGKSIRFRLSEATKFPEGERADVLQEDQRVLVTYREEHDDGPVALQVEPASAAHDS